jgi:SAM-dependent methyltransferase
MMGAREMLLRKLLTYTESEKALPDVARLPLPFIGKGLLRKMLGDWLPRETTERLIWTIEACSDAQGPAANVRNYHEHATLRRILTEVTQGRRLQRAAEVGCGFGRVIVVLREFADFVMGFERERHLIQTASILNPDLHFQQVDDLTDIDDGPFDFMFTSTVLQHLTDAKVRKVLDRMKELTPHGHILLIEKTEAIAVSENTEDSNQFISRARSVETYSEYMKPFTLVGVWDRVIEPTYFNVRPGQCMLFKAP